MRRGRDPRRVEARRPDPSLTAVQIRWLVGFFALTRADRSKAGAHAHSGACPDSTFPPPRALLPRLHDKTQYDKTQ
jgi:hypothetical protein